MKLEKKRLSDKSLEAAIEKAKQYRALNQPDEAISICRDVLDAAADHQAALRILGLALTDEFEQRGTGRFSETLAVFARLTSEFEKVYYAGVAWERRGKAELEKGQANNAAVALETALAQFEKAEKLQPTDSPDAVLRYNRCVRLLTENPKLQAAVKAGHGLHEFQHGD